LIIDDIEEFTFGLSQRPPTQNVKPLLRKRQWSRHPTTVATMATAGSVHTMWILGTLLLWLWSLLTSVCMRTLLQ